jgi:cyclic beta-1,2-glucan synthetase
VDVAFLLGEGRDADEVRTLIGRYREPGRIERALAEVREFWRDGLGHVRIETPSRPLDLLVNGWLPYQTLACRLWGRSALYQSGGAFGFRDQLQDASALSWLWPELTREQILRHAAHQFVEGDVLHWWHPPASVGLRTRFADDLLWLPALTAHYVATTGDDAILSEDVRFLRAPPLEPGEDEVFVRPRELGDSANLYEHCCRAIDRSLGIGAHGLPLFGTGDWNDGMNRVGRGGRGESVWMGFFLFWILGEFAPLCARRGDHEGARRYATHRERLREALERNAWDGEWYRRGWYDDGTPLGSRASDECRIDALVQAWAVLSGAASPERAARAMDSVERHLVSDRDGLIRLLTPPFENTAHDPGYIKGYVRGVRENGGQYTHAALWVVAAMARLGRNDRVAALLEMLSPITRSATRERAAIYQLEPYVVAADVYGEPPHVGRGGWSWYTGSAGWMLRVAIESLLGIRLVHGREIAIAPCVPDDWPGFTITVRLPAEETRYEIRAVNPRRCARCIVSASVDGVTLEPDSGAIRVPLRHDGRTHRVDVVLGPSGPGRATS